MERKFISKTENTGMFSDSVSAFSDRGQNADENMTDDPYFDMDFDIDNTAFDLYADFDIDIPGDMADRILAGTVLADEFDDGHEPDEIELAADAAVERLAAGNDTSRSGAKVIFTQFGKYAASIAACLVLAVGMLTLSVPSGLRIIGVGEDPSSTVVSGEQAGSEGKTETEHAGSSSAAGQQSERISDETMPAAASESGVTASSGSEKSGAAADRKAGADSGAASVLSPKPSGRSDSSGENSESRKNVAPVPTDNSRSEHDASVDTSSQNSNGSSSNNGNYSGSTDNQSDSGDINDGKILDNDPLRTVDNISDLHQYMGYQPAVPSVPSGWAVSSIEVIYGSTAQITYTDGSRTVIYRTSAISNNLNAGVSYEIEESDGGRTLGEDEDGTVRFVSWSDGSDLYSIQFTDGTDRDTALSWASSVS